MIARALYELLEWLLMSVALGRWASADDVAEMRAVLAPAPTEEFN